MKNLNSWAIKILIKVYVVITLIVATILSSPTLSFIPIFLLLWYLYIWKWQVRPTVSLLTQYFMYLSLALLLAPHTGAFFSLLLALPVLFLVKECLEEVAESSSLQITGFGRKPTNTNIGLVVLTSLVLILSLLLNNLTLLLACAVAIGALGVLIAMVLKRVPLKPVEENPVQQRMIAGTEYFLDITLTSKTKIGSLLFIESPCDWLRTSPNILSLKQKALKIKVSLSPSLSGPSEIKLLGQVTDRWGLITTRFELTPIHLFVIPRAKYAATLAEKYLANTAVGSLTLNSNVAAQRPIFGSRGGLEYYGSQLYQQGDNIKHIDWKHSLKRDELVKKIFIEFQGQPAIIQINLAVCNEEEADRLAYDIIVTAITLAQENIPAALAVYDHEGVKITTSTLLPRKLVSKSLEIAQEMVTFVNPSKYMHPTNVSRLRANIRSIKLAKNQASGVVGQLLQMEYTSVQYHAQENPASKALAAAFTKADKKSNVIVISQRNHDAEALEFNALILREKGHTVISI